MADFLHQDYPNLILFRDQLSNMKFTATISAFVAGFITMINAQQVAGTQQDAGAYFTNPILGSVFQANAPYSITWYVYIKEIEWVVMF